MTEINRNRILWHSRRGMLELDLMLDPFVRNRFDALPPALQALYQEFLAFEDQDLYAMLLERAEPPEPRFQPLIRLILENVRGVG